MVDMNFEIVTTGREFEELLYRRLTNAGYACELTPETGDQGVDLVVKAGDTRVAIQCKLYSSAVGNDAVQEVFAGMSYYQCGLAAVVTNATFTESARSLANVTGVRLLHYKELPVYLDTISQRSSRVASRIEDGFTAEMLYGDEPIEELTSSSDSSGMVKLACRYMSGKGVPHSEEEGLRLLKIALGSKSPLAYFVLTVANELFGCKLEDVENAVEVQTKLAEDGLSVARCYIYAKAAGGSYEYELPLARVYLASGNHEEAIDWASRSFEHGNSYAATYLGNYFRDKKTPKHSECAAEEWYKKAADAGEAYALLHCADKCCKRLEFEKCLDLLERAVSVDAQGVVRFLRDSILPVRALSDECRSRAKTLMSSAMDAAGMCVSGSDDLDELIDLARQGVHSALSSLCLTVKRGYGGILVPKARAAAEQGEAWAMQVLAAEYWNRYLSAGSPYLKATELIKAIQYGSDDACEALRGLCSRNEAARQCVLSAMNSDGSLAACLAAKGITVESLTI